MQTIIFKSLAYDLLIFLGSTWELSVQFLWSNVFQDMLFKIINKDIQYAYRKHGIRITKSKDSRDHKKVSAQHPKSLRRQARNIRS